MKVSFLIVGTQKGGTSALHTFLSDHPEICLPKKKEAHFFDKGDFWGYSQANYDDYHRLFETDDRTRVCGEATPAYMYWKQSPKRICQYNRAMKLIFILRNPIERAYSNYMMQVKRGIETLPFSEAIRVEKIRRLRKFPRQDRLFSYVDKGFYVRQIERMERYFSRSQMLFLKTEDLSDRHTETVDKVCEFIGVSPLNHQAAKRVFSNTYEPMSVADRQFLQERYRAEIAKLETLLGWDCSSWMAES
ncbi:MAG: sulfotransferase domain-containing protein [Cyanobacteriota bacterium]|nr:sulfotransferase domain-containing protein [Cyanobacteriota bacterium]